MLPGGWLYPRGSWTRAPGSTVRHVRPSCPPPRAARILTAPFPSAHEPHHFLWIQEMGSKYFELCFPKFDKRPLGSLTKSRKKSPISVLGQTSSPCLAPVPQGPHVRGLLAGKCPPRSWGGVLASAQPGALQQGFPGKHRSTRPPRMGFSPQFPMTPVVTCQAPPVHAKHQHSGQTQVSNSAEVPGPPRRHTRSVFSAGPVTGPQECPSLPVTSPHGRAVR